MCYLNNYIDRCKYHNAAEIDDIFTHNPYYKNSTTYNHYCK